MVKVPAAIVPRGCGPRQWSRITESIPSWPDTASIKLRAIDRSGVADDAADLWLIVDDENRPAGKMMEILGKTLMGVGAAVGVAAGLWVAVGIQTPGMSWIVAVGLVKLTIVASLALMGAGAMLTRVGHRSRRARETERLLREARAEPIQPAAQARHRRERD